MKRSKKKGILIIASLCVVLIIALGIISDDDKNYENTSYSSYSAKNPGAKAFYLSVQKFGEEKGLYDTKTYKKLARFIPKDSLFISLAPDLMLITKENEVNAIRNHVRNGLTYIILTDKAYDANYNSIIEGMVRGEIDLPGMIDSDKYDVYNFPGRNKGKIIISPLGDEIVNGSMKSDYDVALDLIMYIAYECKASSYNTVYFNEYYLTGEYDMPGSDIYGIGLLLLIIQICITIVFWMIYKGVRFGSPEVVVQTIKRNETENIYALAGLYKRTKSPDIAFDVHMESLMTDVAVYLGYNRFDESNKEQIINEINSNTVLVKLGADKLFKLYFNSEKRRIKQKDLKNIIKKIEDIRKELL